MWRLLACLVAACGRIGFDPGALGDAATDAAGGDAVARSLACGESQAVATPAGTPVGLGLAPTAGGVMIVWTAGASTKLAGVRVGLGTDEIVALDPVASELPQAIAGFGFASDGDARYLLAAPVASGAMLVILDGQLAPGAPILQPATEVTPHAIAAPVTAGADFVATWILAGQAQVMRIDTTGKPAGIPYLFAATGGAAVRSAALRDITVWASAGGGCAVWAADAAFAPVRPAPLVHAPAGTCRSPLITRNTTGTNLLAWVDGGAAHAQLGTDTATVGPELSIGAAADQVEIAASLAGFFTAVGSATSILPSYLRRDATGLTSLSPLPRLPGTPLRMIEHGPTGALVASIAGPPTAPQVLLTRLCEP